MGWERSGLVEIPWSELLSQKTIVAPDGRSLPAQVVQSGSERRLLLEASAVPSLGYRAFPLVNSLASHEPEAAHFIVTPELLENSYYRMKLNPQGQILSLYDKTNHREVLTGPGNVLQLFEDRPLQGEAW